MFQRSHSTRNSSFVQSAKRRPPSWPSTSAHDGLELSPGFAIIKGVRVFTANAKGPQDGVDDSRLVSHKIRPSGRTASDAASNQARTSPGGRPADRHGPHTPDTPLEQDGTHRS